MNISCDMAIDLISLYKDGLASEDSKRAVREHLRHCRNCARIYAAYSSQTEPPLVRKYVIPMGREGGNYAMLAKTLRRSRMVSRASMFSVVALSVGLGAYCLLRMLSMEECGPNGQCDEQGL